MIIGTESLHAGLRRSDEVHNCHITHTLGSEMHRRMSLRSVVFFNSKNYPRPSGNPASYVHNKNNNVPPNDDIPVSNDDVSPNVTTQDNIPRTLSVSPSPTVPDIPQVLEDDSPVEPAPPPSEPVQKSLSDHLSENGMQIRPDILTTDSGNCW